MRFANRTRAITAAAVIFAIGAALAQGWNGTISVDPDFLIWQKGFTYMTQIRIRLTLEDVKFQGKRDGKSVEGEQARAFGFFGAMRYETEAIQPGAQNGRAKRVHNQCDITKTSVTEPVIKMEAKPGAKILSWFDDGIPTELEKDWEIFRYQEKGKIIIKPKHDKAHEILERADKNLKKIAELAKQPLPAFNRMEYALSWDVPESVRNAQLTVKPTEPGVVISQDVKDLISREARFLFEQIMGANEKRMDGEEWMIHAEVLESMIHPALEGTFEGKVAVQATKVTNANLPNYALGGQITGWHLKFVPHAYQNNIRLRSDLTFICKDVDGKKNRVDLSPIGEGKRFEGELWLDADNKMVRAGRLICSNAVYEGKMPKIEDLNMETAKLNAEINFQLDYIQTVAEKGEDE